MGLFDIFKRRDVTWESKMIDREHLFRELGKALAMAKRVDKDYKVELPDHLRIPAIRSKQLNDYDIVVTGNKYKDILKSKQDHHFGNFN